MQKQVQKNIQDFTGQNIYVGVDAHLKSWKMTLLSDQSFLRTVSMVPSPQQLHQWLTKNYPGATYHSAYEAGYCGFWIHKNLVALGINSMVVNAADIPTTHKEKVQKEDARDSRKIAESLRSGKLVPLYVPSDMNLADRSLVRTRLTIVRELARYKNRIKSFLHFYGTEIPYQHFKNGYWSQKFIVWLKALEYEEPSARHALDILIEQVESMRIRVLSSTRLIRKLSETEVYAPKMKLLQSCGKGIGLLTAMLLLTHIDDFKRFRSFDKFCSFVGCIPSMHASGDNNATGKMIPRKNAVVFSHLVEAAWIAIRYDAELMRHFNAYAVRSNPNKAIVRVVKKILGRMRFVMINDTPYVCPSSSMKHPS